MFGEVFLFFLHAYSRVPKVSVVACARQRVYSSLPCADAGSDDGLSGRDGRYSQTVAVRWTRANRIPAPQTSRATSADLKAKRAKKTRFGHNQNVWRARCSPIPHEYTLEVAPTTNTVQQCSSRNGSRRRSHADDNDGRLRDRYATRVPCTAAVVGGGRRASDWGRESESSCAVLGTERIHANS